MNEPSLILGIETSCDETAAALADAKGRLHANLVASQVDLHARYGGVVPEIAARMHIQACLPLVEQALAEARVDWDAIAGIAVTQGPGLIGCLLVGVETAKVLAWQRRKPLYAVNHLAGHLETLNVTPRKGTHLKLEDGVQHRVLPTNRDGESPDKLEVARPDDPHVGLIVSGGHTSLVLSEGPDRHQVLAETRDDAAGEAYDKVARLLGLGYPGGPVIDRLAGEAGEAQRFRFTPPMMRPEQRDFSFSGLKTAAGREAERLLAEHEGRPAEESVRDLCAAFQRAAVESLVGKAMREMAARRIRDLVITGGVACNQGLRRRAAEASRHGVRVWFPHPSLCTDNAGMIAALAWRMQPLTPAEALELEARADLGLA